MDPDFALTKMEWIFLGGALLVTVPLLVFIRWILLELKKEKAQESKN